MKPDFSYQCLKKAATSKFAGMPWDEFWKAMDDVALRFVEFPVVSHVESQQVHYWTMRLDGESHNMAQMLATRSFPGTHGTDRAFMQGRQLDGSQFDGIPLVGEHHRRLADRSGVSTTGKWYSGTLARFPGDPEAWVDSLGDVKKICERRGWEARGAINVDAPKYAAKEPEPYKVADDLVGKYVDMAIEENPDLGDNRANVAEDIAEKLGGIW